MTDRAPDPAVPSPARAFSYAIETMRQVERYNAEGGLPVDVRFRSGSKPSLSVEGVQSRFSSLSRTASQTGFSTLPKVWDDKIAVSFVTGGTILRHDLIGEQASRSHLAMMTTSKDMCLQEVSAGFASLTVTLPQSALAAAHAALEGQDGPAPLPRFVPVVDATGRPLQALRSTMDTVLERLKAGVEDADLVFPLLEEIMVYRLLSVWPREGQDPVQRGFFSGPRPLRLAREFIDGNLSDKLLLSDVAAAAGVGVRRLQAMFKAETGRTPVQFILERRLERVRADLGTASDGLSIHEIASRWGFTHMGDFGRRYRARFGEPPSLTRRARRPEPPRA